MQGEPEVASSTFEAATAKVMNDTARGKLVIDGGGKVQSKEGKPVVTDSTIGP